MRLSLKVLLGCLAVALLVMGGAAAGLLWAHYKVRAEHAPLPPYGPVLDLQEGDDLPIALRWVNTASQRAPGTTLAPDTPAHMSYPVFVVEWADGRLLLVDAGMDAAAARAFGRPLELVLGADPMEPGRVIGSALGEAASAVVGIAFTHLHVDHTQGVESLCGSRQKRLRAYLTEAQMERFNYTTRGGVEQVHAALCLRRRVLGATGLVPLADLSGVAIIPVAGHTPGSLMVVVWVRTGDAPPRGYILAGDVVLEAAAIARDSPKPLLYRWFVVPEDEDKLGEVRRWLRGLEQDHGLTVLPSHDQASVERAGLVAFAAPATVAARP